ncbi:MAG: hypothetical protein AAGK97_05730 [Bacteroidota bacterium]
MEDQKEFIIYVLKKSNTKNLRILKICLKTCRLAFEKLDYPITFYDELILLIFALTIETKKSRPDKTSLELLERWIDEGYDFTYAYGASRRHIEEEKQDSSYLTKFITKYYDSIFNTQISSKAIFDYIITGYFNRDTFNQEILIINNKVKTPKSIFLEDFSQLSNEEFTKAAEEYFDELRNCKIQSPLLLLRLCKSLFYFSEKQLIPQSHQDISDIFQQSIGILNRQNLLNYEPLYIYAYNHVLSDPEWLKQNQYYLEIKRQIEEINDIKHPDTLRRSIDELINILEADPDKFFKFVYKNHKHTQETIFEYINVFKFKDVILQLSNSNLSSLTCFFKHRYNSECINKWYLNEKANLQKIKNLLDADINNMSDDTLSLQDYLVSELRDEIDNVIKSLDKIHRS